ncbi:MAG TPA: hypothetical protein VEO53_14600, partial [Candidatus Binatia bacterium]|nr:hypothetical protein [Candidatus Binatia bacterium]
GMAAPPPSVRAAAPSPLLCARCDTALDFVGTKRFHEGSRWGVLGDLGELFVKRERFDVFVCPRCGRVEFFVDGIGEEYRAQPPAAPAVTAEERVDTVFQEAAQLEAQGELPAAVARYEELVARYPGTNFARDAEQRLRMIRDKLNL